jgi:GTP-binding protein
VKRLRFKGPCSRSLRSRAKAASTWCKAIYQHVQGAHVAEQEPVVVDPRFVPAPDRHGGIARR